MVRQDVVSDGVSEAGVPAATVAASLGRLYDVELVTFADADPWSIAQWVLRIALALGRKRRAHCQSLAPEPPQR